MVSTDAASRLGGRRVRAALGWLPVAILGIVALGAGGVVIRSEGPSSRAPLPDEDGEVAVLSVRRSLDPLLRRAADARLRTRLDDFLATQPPDTCLSVRSETVEFAHREDDPQSPASLQKLLVATAALLEFGADATYETEVIAATVADGVVAGDLFVRGGGDPILSTPAYAARERNQPQIFSNVDALVDAVVAAGVTTVEGSVVGDESRYDTERYNPAWPSRFLAQGQIGPLSALSVNDSFAYFPEETGVFGAAPEPAVYAAQVVTDALRARGVVVNGDPVGGPTPPGLELVASHESPPMSAIVTQMLQESDNNTAELVLKELGLQRTGSGSFEGGRTAVREVLTEAGLDLDAAAVFDGSGLAVEDQVTCRLVADVLDHAPTENAVESALAVAGESGTLARRWLGTDLVGRVAAKTGTLNQVTGLAGHAQPSDGSDPILFALLVNLPPSEVVGLELVAGQERLAQILTAHPDLPDVSGLRPSSDAGT